MTTNLMKRFGTLTAVLALAGAGLVAGTTAASAAPVPAPAVTAIIPTVFDLNGTFSDGGSARPVIKNASNILTVDMSSQRRPAAHGIVLTSDSIMVTFPDDGTYTAKLEAPGLIRWSNQSTWQKTSRVPSVIGLTVPRARSYLTALGFRVGTVTTWVDRNCFYISTVARQSPAAGTAQLPGTAINLVIGVRPPTPCP